MINKKSNNEKPRKQVIYVKPVLTYDQIVEIIDERIAFIEKVANKKEEKMKKK